MHRSISLVTTLLLGGCGKGSLDHPAIYVPPACEARFVGQVMAESVAVDADGESIYWLDYHWGTLQRRSRGVGAIETLREGSDEHLTESMRVAGPYAYWTSKALGGLYRMALAGGGFEQLVPLEMPLDVEIVGDVVCAASASGTLAWWRSASEQGVLQVSDGTIVLAASQDALYVGSEDGIQRLASPGAGLQDELSTDAPVEAIAISGDTLAWKEGNRVMRRVRGAVQHVMASNGYTRLAGTPGGVLIGESNVIWFAADAADGVVPVAITPASITDLEVRGPSVFVGTSQGSVHEVCVDPAQPVALQDPAPCDGAGCAWFASGALAARDGSTFYADGTPATAREGDQLRVFFVDGTEATGAPWAGE